MKLNKMYLLISCLCISQLPAITYAEQNEPVEIRFSWWGGSQRHKATNAALNAFREKYPNITVKAEYSGFDGYLSRFSTQMAAGEEPDVIRIDWNWLPRFSRDGKGFYDINKVAKDAGLENFNPQDIQSATVENSIQGLPFSVSYRTLFYNKSSWEKAGLAYPKTWDELFTSGKVFKEKLGDDYYPLSLTSGITEALDIMTLCRTYMTQKYGIDMIDENKKGLSYTPEQTKEFIGVYKKLVDEHVIPSQTYYAGFGRGNTNETKQWIKGQFGGMFIWTSSYNNYASNLENPSDLQEGPFITMPGAKDLAINSKPAGLFSISKNTKHPKESAMLINFLLNEKAGVEALLFNNGVPISKPGIEIISAMELRNGDKTLLDAYKFAASQPATKIPLSIFMETPELIKLWTDTIQSLDYGKQTLDEAAESFANKANRILKKAMR